MNLNQQMIAILIMQYNHKQYDPEQHDLFKALSVNSPYAEYIKDGSKTIELRNQNTSYRGDILICTTYNKASKQPGHTLVLVELFYVKKCAEFSSEDVESCKVNNEVWNCYKNTGYGWLLRNPRPVIEYPIKGQLGIFNLVYTKDCIIEYPTKIKNIPLTYQQALNPRLTAKLRERERQRSKFKKQLIVVTIGIFATLIALLFL